MNPFINVFTDTVDFDEAWDEFTSLIATTEDILLLLEFLNENASFGGNKDWSLRMYAWVMAMTNNELTPNKGDK